MGWLDTIANAPGWAAGQINSLGSQAINWIGGNQGTANAQTDRGLTSGALAQGSPYMGANPYAGNYNQLINTLQGRANGQGPNLAGDAYNQAAANAQNEVASLARGNSPGAARAAIQQYGNIGQGLANGYATARNQEMVGATGQLGQALNGASNANFQTQQANQQAWLQILAQQLGLTKAQMGMKTNGQVLGDLIPGLGQASKVLGSS